MKRKLIYMFVFILLMFSLVGCNEEMIIQGILGNQGTQSEITTQGPQGDSGKDGRSVVSITLTSSDDNIDTYTITYSDNTTTTFAVTNGKDGVDGAQGIQGIQGVPGKDGHTPIITIQNGYWYIDGVNTNVLAEGVKGETGKGISSIEKTSTEGLVDTYTITFTDGTTTTFTVTNGQDAASISKVEYDSFGRLVFTLSNGVVLDPVELPDLEVHEHDFCEWIIVKNPTCIEKGVESRFCLECNYTESRFVDELGHDEVVTKKAKLPTNELTGTSEEKQCRRCNEITQQQTFLDAKGTDWMVEDGHIKILMIGNSYTQDASNVAQPDGGSQMFSIIQSMVGDDVEVTLAIIINGGKGMNWHATKAENDEQAYTLQVISTSNPKWKNVKKVSPREALSWTDWDIVTLQPYNVNTSTGIEQSAYPEQTNEKFNPFEVSTGYLLDYVNLYAPQAEVYCYMHWAQTKATNINTNLSAYNKIGEYFINVTDLDGELSGKRFSAVVPVGLAIQNARSTYLAQLQYNTSAYDDNNLNYVTDAQIGLQRDGGHVSYNIGRYIAGLTFAEMIIPQDIRDADYIIPDIRKTESVGILPEEYSVIARKSVYAAIVNWKNGITTVTNIDEYEKNPIEIYCGSFTDFVMFETEINNDNITEYLSKKLYEDMVLENFKYLGCSNNKYEFKVIVKYGYTTREFIFNCGYKLEKTIELQYDDYLDEIEKITTDSPIEFFDDDCLEIITINNKKMFHANNVGQVVIKTNDGLYEIIVNKAKISLVLIMGQSNAGCHFDNATSDITNPLGTAYWWKTVSSKEPVNYIEPSMGFHAPLLAEMYAQSVADNNPIKNVMIWHEGTTSLNGKSIVAWVPKKGDLSKMTGTVTMVSNCINYYEQNADKYEIVNKGMYWYQGESDVNMDPQLYTDLFMDLWGCLQEVGMDYVAFFRVRKGISYNTIGTNHEDLDYHKALAAQIKMINDNENFYMATSITENWTGDDSTEHTVDIINYITLMNEYSGSDILTDEYDNNATYSNGKLTTTMYTLFGAKRVNYCHYGKFGAAIIGADAAYNMYNALYKNNVSIIQGDTSGKPINQNISKIGDTIKLDLSSINYNLSFRANNGSKAGVLSITVLADSLDITNDVICMAGNNYGTVDRTLLSNYDDVTILVMYDTFDIDTGIVIYEIV